MADNGHEIIATKEILVDEQDESVSFSSFISWLSAAGEVIPPWWSQQRDLALRNFWKQSDHLSGTINTLRDMLVAVPFEVKPRDRSIKSHVRQAQEFQDLLLNRFLSRGNVSARGWGVGFGACVEDYHTQDNGLFIAIDGPGPADGPLTGMPTRLWHLDSYRCQRTGSREFPVVFNDLDGRRHKIHQARLLAMSSMSSPIAEMYGVGFCATSRSIWTAQNLIDIARYKAEKLGSRPRRGMMVMEGSTPKEAELVANVLKLADEGMDNKLLTRFSMIPVVTSKGAITLLDLASLPDGFDELTSTQLGMSVLALAFGVDVRQLGFAIGAAGQTKADAEVQHLKMRGKGPGLFIQETQRQFNHKVLPPHLELVFDYQDDEQDKLQAENREKRAKPRVEYVNSGIWDIRQARLDMVETDDLSKEDFVKLELREGRLEDGSPLVALFQSNDSAIQALLEGIDPLQPNMELIEERKLMAQDQLLNAPTRRLKDAALSVLALLNTLGGEKEEEELTEDSNRQRPEVAEEKARKLDKATAIGLVMQELFTKEQLPPVINNQIALPDLPAPIVNVTLPDHQKQGDVVVNVPKQEPPIINVEAPQVTLQPELNLNATLEQPNEIVESETFVQRNPMTDLVQSTIKRTQRRGMQS